jgi:hypothetical protein
MQTPVEDGRCHRQTPCGFDRFGIGQCAFDNAKVAAQRVIAPGGAEIVNRLQHAKEHQANAHARGEQHREPAQVAVIRRRIEPANPHLAQGRDEDAKADDDKDVRGRQEEPVEGRGQKSAHSAKGRSDRVLEHQRQDDESHNHQPGNGKDGVVDIQPERADLWGNVVLTDLVIGLDHLGRPFGFRDRFNVVFL